MNDAKVREECEVAIDRVEGDIGMFFMHGGKQLLRRGEGLAFQESIEDSASLRGQLVALGAQQRQMIFCHDGLLSSRGTRFISNHTTAGKKGVE